MIPKYPLDELCLSTAYDKLESLPLHEPYLKHKRLRKYTSAKMTTKRAINRRRRKAAKRSQRRNR